jgi:hypothetical protein
MALKNSKMDMPFPDIFPESWKKEFPQQGFKFLDFRNLEHFKYEVGQLKQINDMQCGVSYGEALADLVQGKSNFPDDDKASIRNLVRSNLLKRGLITEEVYENFRYTSDGTQVDVDVGKYAAGESDCVITPSRQYIDFFYELYISISYPYTVADSLVRKNVAKLLATIEELERRHIFIKITLVFPAKNSGYGAIPHFFSTIPLFHHKEPKSVDTMASVVNERLLRKFYFAILEEVFGNELEGGYGKPVTLSKAMNIGSEFNEIDFYEEVVNLVGA